MSNSDLEFSRLEHWYEKNEDRISAFFLVVGFTFDSLTLSQIDSFNNNLWIGLNILFAMVAIVLLNKEEHGWMRKLGEKRLHFWTLNFLQFCFGNIIGAFLIFYFRSATLAVTWPFILILFAVLIGGEIFKKKYERLTFQIATLYLSIFSFSIYIVPLATKHIGWWVFLLSGLVSIFVLWMFVRAIRYYSPGTFRQNRPVLRKVVGMLFITINILYFTNLIPPLPLSLKDAGIYHSLAKNTRGDYLLSEEKRGIFGFFHIGNTLHIVTGSTVYAFSSIYSPTDFDVDVVHEWDYYSDTEGKWLVSTRIPLSVSGGRDEGFRTYSKKSNLTEGRWRVQVKTKSGQVIGRMNFSIEFVERLPELVSLTN